jgi:hypothetical protein
MRTLLLVVALCAGVLLPPARALAAPPHDDPIQVEATLDQSTVRTGDQVKLKIAVMHPARVQLRFPDAAALQATGLEVIRTQPGQGSRSLDGTQTTVMEYMLAGFAPKTYDLPPIVIAYDAGNGVSGSITASPTLRLTVESVLAALPNASLRDIRPPLAVPGAVGLALRPIAAAALALALSLLTVLLVLRLLRRRYAIALPLPPPTPEMQVRAALQQAAEMLKAPHPDFLLFYTAVADAVRAYLEARTDLPALSSTTRELRRMMEARRTDRWHARIILGLLDECDSVKWAHYAPDTARAERALTMAYEVVELVGAGTEPEPPAVPLRPARAHG